MLSFVGLGLYDERSITVEGREAVAAADHVFAEFFTSRLCGATTADLEAFHGVGIEVCDREAVEGTPEPILEAAESGSAAFLVVGDPLVSTTHVDLRLRADDRGIETRIVHGTSAQTAAAGLTGLQNYRFGKATTLPFPRDGATVPPSVLGAIESNADRGLHTLVYLDIDAEREEYLDGGRAAELLAGGVDGSRLGVVVGGAGGPDPVVRADRLDRLAGGDFGPALHLLVLPGELHHLEAAALEAFAGAPAGLVDPG